MHLKLLLLAMCLTGTHLSPSDIFGPWSATEKTVCSALNEATSCTLAPTTTSACDALVSRTHVCAGNNDRLSLIRQSATTHKAFMTDDIRKSTTGREHRLKACVTNHAPLVLACVQFASSPIKVTWRRATSNKW